MIGDLFKHVGLLIVCFLCFSCKDHQQIVTHIIVPEQEKESSEPTRPPKDSVIYDGLVELKEDGRIIDLKYATDNNFVKAAVYSCPRCFVKKELAKVLQAVEIELAENNLQLIYFDCLRPQQAQEQLWAILPNPTYVTNPAKGSMHSRGLAVDVGLADADGNRLDMGSAFDYFGRASHIDNFNFPDSILSRRSILFNTMGKYGLKGIRTEWWHYSFRSTSAPLISWEWPCDDE